MLAFLRAIARRLDIGKYRYKGFECDPFSDFETLTVSDAFKRYAGFDLADYLTDVDAFREKVNAAGIRVASDDAWDDSFFRVMDTLIEPKLGMGRPTFLCDYPVAMASLSRPKKTIRFAERFELYVCGVELANAFSELTDADVQRERYADEMAIKERLYGERYPLDEEFIKALEYGMPESGGIALGIDRLVMLAVNEDKIENILWCGKP